jgi:hypothetical protein
MIERRALRTVAILAALALGAAACDKPAGPTVVTIVNNNTNTNNNGQSGVGAAEPTVKGSVTSDTKSLTVNGMKDGEVCPAGITPANENRKLKLGCDLAVTVNPRDAAGHVIQDDHAPAVDYFILAEGFDVVDFKHSSDNTYNGSVHAKAPGKFGFLASVAGVATTELQEFEVVR